MCGLRRFDGALAERMYTIGRHRVRGVCHRGWPGVPRSTVGCGAATLFDRQCPQAGCRADWRTGGLSGGQTGGWKRVCWVGGCSGGGALGRRVAVGKQGATPDPQPSGTQGEPRNGAHRSLGVVWSLIWDRCEADAGSIRGRRRVDPRSVQEGFRVDSGPFRGRSEADLGRFGVDSIVDLGSIRGNFLNNCGLRRFYRGARAPPPPDERCKQTFRQSHLPSRRQPSAVARCNRGVPYFGSGGGGRKASGDRIRQEFIPSGLPGTPESQTIRTTTGEIRRNPFRWRRNVLDTMPGRIWRSTGTKTKFIKFIKIHQNSLRNSSPN